MARDIKEIVFVILLILLAIWAVNKDTETRCWQIEKEGKVYCWSFRK